MPTDHIDLYLFDTRQGHGGKVTVRKDQMFDLDPLLAAAQQIHPTYTMEALVRYVWVRGLDAFRMAVATERLPEPTKHIVASSSKGKLLA